MQTVRDALRAATADLHTRLDARTERLDFSDRQTYGRFLQAQSGPVIALEEALEAVDVMSLLPDWLKRSRRLALLHDLEDLGLSPTACHPVALRSEPEAWGTLYVLEGSRIGARFLLQRVLATATPELRTATQFLRQGEGLGLWPVFLKQLEKNVAAGDLGACREGAVKAFSLFDASFAKAFTRDPVPAG